MIKLPSLIIEEDAISSLPSILNEFLESKRCLIVTGKTSYGIIGEKIKTLLEKNDWNVKKVFVESTDENELKKVMKKIQSKWFSMGTKEI